MQSQVSSTGEAPQWVLEAPAWSSEAQSFLKELAKWDSVRKKESKWSLVKLSVGYDSALEARLA